MSEKIKYNKIEYKDLNARQQENYNFAKISSVLADYGYITVRLSDDWKGADFIMLHKDGTRYNVQLKGRLSFDEKYIGKDLYIAFYEANNWYIYPHDEILRTLIEDRNIIGDTEHWKSKCEWSMKNIPKKHQDLFEPYKIPAIK